MFDLLDPGRSVGAARSGAFARRLTESIDTTAVLGGTGTRKLVFDAAAAG